MLTYHERILSSWAAAAVACVAAVSAGCAATPRESRVLVNNEEVAQDFAQLHIRDVAILPVRVGSDGADSVGSLVREEMKRTLVAKLYSPLSFDSIDKKLGPVADRRTFEPAQFKGTFDEDAILTTELTQWDEQWLRSHNQVLMGAKMTLYHSPSGKIVWSRELRNKEVEVPGPITTDTARVYEEEAIRKFVREAMRGLPKKVLTADSEGSSASRN